MLVQQHPCTVRVSLCSGSLVRFMWFAISGGRTGCKCCNSGRCVGARCSTGCFSVRWYVVMMADRKSDALDAGHVSVVTVTVNEMVLLIECFNE
jgi:uncharacterized membrane protein